jgi:hypothetical protein
MDITFRALFVDAPIALPLPESCGDQALPDWKAMSKDKFMEKYGNKVRAQYNIPTEEELAMLNEGEEMDPEADDDRSM